MSTTPPKKSISLKRSRSIDKSQNESIGKDIDESVSDSASGSISGSISRSDSNESDSDSDSNESDSDNDDIPQPFKKPKLSIKKESENFSNAMNALLDTHLKAYDRKDPILVRSKKDLKKFDDDKLEQKAKKILLNEKKKKLTANRIKNLLPTNESTAREILQHEKILRKTAQRGVIKLFNAILMTQTNTQFDINNENGLIGNQKKKQLLNEISKENFLSLVKNSAK